MGIKEIHLLGHKTLTIHELDDVYNSSTGRALTGAWLWDASLFLAAAICSSPDLSAALRGKSVVELGAGTAGVPGLTAALLGARRVVLTDVAVMVPALRLNAAANGLGGPGAAVEVAALVEGECAAGVDEQFDVVVMSEVFFDAADMVALAAAVRRVRRRTGGVVWAATEVRPWTTVECLRELEAEGFEVVELVTARPASWRLGGGGGESELDSERLFAVYGLVDREGGGHVADGGEV